MRKILDKIRDSRDSSISEIIGYILVFSIVIVIVSSALVVYVPDSGTNNELSYQASALQAFEALNSRMFKSTATSGYQVSQNIPMGIQSSFLTQTSATTLTAGGSTSNYSLSYGLRVGIQVQGHSGTGANYAYNKVIDSVNVGSSPDGIVYNPHNGNIYCVNYVGSLVVISGSSNTVIATVKLPAHPYAITYDSGDNSLVIAMYNSTTNGGQLVAVSAATNHVLQSVSMAPQIIYDVAYDPLTGDVLISFNGNSRYGTGAGLEVLNASTFIQSHPTLTVTQDPSAIPSALTYDPANGLIYVAGGRYLWAINSVTYQLANLYSVYSPWGAAFNSYNGNVYVTAQTVSGGSGIGAITPNTGTYSTMYIYNGTTSAQESKVTTGSSPTNIIYDPANRNIYVTCYNSNQVWIYNGMDPSITTPVQKIRVGNGPGGGFNSMTYDPVNGNVYVCNMNSGNVSVIQGNTILGKGWSISGNKLPLDYTLNGGGQVSTTGYTSFVKQQIYSIADGTVLTTDTSGNGNNNSALPFGFNLTSGFLGMNMNLVNLASSQNVSVSSTSSSSVTLTLRNQSEMGITSGQIVNLYNKSASLTVTAEILNVYLVGFTYTFTSSNAKAWAYSYYRTYVNNSATQSYVNSLTAWKFSTLPVAVTVSGNTLTFQIYSPIVLYSVNVGYYNYGVQLGS